MTSPFNLRRPAISFELLASFAALRAKRREERLMALQETTMQVHLTPPRDPNQVPDTMKDDVKTDNPAPSDFNDDGDDEDGFDDDGEADDEED